MPKKQFEKRRKKLNKLIKDGDPNTVAAAQNCLQKLVYDYACASESEDEADSDLSSYSLSCQTLILIMKYVNRNSNRNANVSFQCTISLSVGRKANNMFKVRLELESD